MDNVVIKKVAVWLDLFVLFISYLVLKRFEGSEFEGFKFQD